MTRTTGRDNSRTAEHSRPVRDEDVGNRTISATPFAGGDAKTLGIRASANAYGTGSCGTAIAEWNMRQRSLSHRPPTRDRPMTPARLTLVNTRTIRGLALVPDTLDGRRSQDRTDTCLDHCETDQGSACLTSHSAADEAGRGLGIPTLNLRATGRFARP